MPMRKASSPQERQALGSVRGWDRNRSLPDQCEIIGRAR